MKKKGKWDFVKVGNSYQYKEGTWIALLTILEDNSTDEMYQFKSRIEKSLGIPPVKDSFSFSFSKTFEGGYGGMSQLYESAVYPSELYTWSRNEST